MSGLEYNDGAVPLDTGTRSPPDYVFPELFAVHLRLGQETRIVETASRIFLDARIAMPHR
jgi:hypothetical protein